MGHQWQRIVKPANLLSSCTRMSPAQHGWYSKMNTWLTSVSRKHFVASVTTSKCTVDMCSNFTAMPYLLQFSDLYLDTYSCIRRPKNLLRRSFTMIRRDLSDRLGRTKERRSPSRRRSYVEARRSTITLA